MAIDPTWIKAGSDIIGALVKPPSAAPQTAISGAPVNVLQDFDFSGFTVGTGGSKVTGAPNNKVSSPGVGAPATAQGAGSWLPGLLVGGAALAGLIWAQ